MGTNKFKQKLLKTPLSLVSVGLGISSFGNITELVASDFTKDIIDYNDINNHIFQIICMIITFLILILMVIRIFVSFDNFKKELADPILCSFLSSIPVAGTILSGFVASIPTFYNNLLLPTVNAATIIGAIMLIISFLFYLLILVSFFYFSFNKHNLKKNYTYWAVPVVSLIVLSIVSGNFPEEIFPKILFEIIWYFGVSAFIIFIPYILYKTTFDENIEKDRIPAIASLAAPSSITLMGFISVFTFNGQPIPGYNESFVVSVILIFIMISFALWLFLLLSLFKIFQTKFNSSYSALALPSTIAPIAMFNSHIFFRSYGSSEAISNLFLAIAFVQVVLAFIIMVYLVVRFSISIPKWIKLEPVIKS